MRHSNGAWSEVSDKLARFAALLAASPAPAIRAVDPVAVPRALLASLVDDVEEYAGRHSFREREQEVRAREIARARVILAAPAISESEDAARLDWLTDRLEDAVIDGADPAKYLPDDVGDGNEEGAAACRRAWRLAIDAARKGEKS
ncbi:hypothetical protein C6Q13_10830 [Burkholderia gladioli]|nr:hypothetical protein C6Q13_10830 [Burkholderia gladioli]